MGNRKRKVIKTNQERRDGDFDCYTFAEMMKLAQIRGLIEGRQYDEALRECDILLGETSETNLDVLRVRSYGLARSGNFYRSVEDHRTICASNEATMKDYYKAGFDALYAGEFATAIEWFQEVLRLGDEQNDEYFKSASLFYLSYAFMEVSNYKDSIHFLNQAVEIESDVAMPIPIVGMCHNSNLRDEIERRCS